MYVLTDIHFLSKKMWVEGNSINAREQGDQIAVKATPEIFDTFCEKIISDKYTENVLITGDLINNGDLQSHKDFIAAAEKLKKAGKKVYVITSTHDYSGNGKDENFFKAVRYTRNGTEEAESVYKTDLPRLYADFGINSADSVDKESSSYSVCLQEGYRLIAINDIGNGRSHCGLFDEGFDWLEGELQRAEDRNEYVILAVHHPVLAPFPLYPALVEFEMFGGYKKMRELLCRYNVKVIFTGHTHVQGIKKYKDSEGRSFFDITTSALPSAEGKMRKVVFDRDAGKCKVESIGIDRINNFETEGKSARDYIYSLNFSGLLEEALKYRKENHNLFIEKASRVFGDSLFKNHKIISELMFSFLDSAKMSFFAALGGKNCRLNEKEKQKLREEYVKTVFFEVLKHIFSGNGVYTPDTPEYKALTGFTAKIDRLLAIIRFDISDKLEGINSVTEMITPFLYNVRTGDDDKIEIDLEK